MAVYPEFIGGSYTSQSPIADQEYTMNWYPEKIESRGGSSRMALYPTPGVELLDTAASGEGRANFFQNGRQFLIIGATFYEADINGTLTSRGTVATDANPATICGNGDAGGQLFITSGGNGYLFVLATNTLSAIAALAGIATMGDFLDGYGLCLDATTSTMFISDLLDLATWDPTQYIQNSISSDNWVSMKVSNRYIYLWGSETGQIWYDAGSFPIPFEPHPSGLMQYGCAAPFSPELVGGGVCWLSSTGNGQGAVIRTSGFQPEIISNYATHYAFDTYTDISDAIGDSYEDSGHTFYILTFVTASATWVWDSQLGIWHNRGTWDSINFEYQPWRPCFHAFAFSEHRMIDILGSGLYRMAIDLQSDVDDLAIRRVRRAPCLVNENRLNRYAQFEVDLETGLGTATGQGSDPVMMMRYSNDGGKTWSNEISASTGLTGEYFVRAIWNRCGAGRKRVFEVSTSDPVPYRLIDAYVKIASGSEQA